MNVLRRALLERLPRPERSFVLSMLREETVGGALLLLAAVVAMVWANSGWRASYLSMREVVIGPAALHLDLSLQTWAADGLLAIFFFVAGLELKREVVCGQLSRLSAALLPVVAAVAGMVVPAGIYLLVAAGNPALTAGWAVPMATDIAFALAVLAVIGSALPTALRAFLLTMAVVDDLGAILVIALVFSSKIDLIALGGAAVLLALYAWLQHRRVTAWWIYVPLALLIWALVHAGGVHATIAGVAIGLLTRVRPDRDEEHSPAERLEHRVRPLSAGVAVPAFALLSAGVPLAGGGLGAALTDRAVLAVVAGLVLGKFVGVLGGSWVVARFTRAELHPDIAWADMAGVALLGGVGFTVSLLIGELAFAGDPVRAEHVKLGILLGSLLAAALAAILLRARNAAYRRIDEAASEDPAEEAGWTPTGSAQGPG